MGVADELKAKRGELAGHAHELAATLAELQGQIAAVDKVISIYEPEGQPQKRRGRPPSAMSAKELDKLIGGTNKRQMTLEILRTARRPMSTAECAQDLVGLRVVHLPMLVEAGQVGIAGVLVGDHGSVPADMVADRRPGRPRPVPRGRCA
jgi:hypothetical protein